MTGKFLHLLCSVMRNLTSIYLKTQNLMPSLCIAGCYASVSLKEATVSRSLQNRIISEAQMAQQGAHLRGQTWGYCNPYHGPPDSKRQREKTKSERPWSHAKCVWCWKQRKWKQSKCASCMVVSGLCWFSACVREQCALF